MVREIRIFQYEMEEELPEIKNACARALAEHVPLQSFEIGFDFERKQVSLLLAFDTMPDCLGFEDSKENLQIETLLNPAVLVHRYWRENNA